MSRLILIGAGGHGKVVADSANLTQNWKQVEFLDDRYPQLSSLFSWKVIGKVSDYEKLASDESDFGVSIGEANVRMDIIKKLLKSNARLPTIAHPTSSISDFTTIGDATVVMAQSAINIGSKIGIGCIINTGATIDHDCTLKNGVHVSPGSHLAGGVSIGEQTSIGVGAVVCPGLTLGDKVIVGAGAVVINDVEDGLTVVGNPAKPI